MSSLVTRTRPAAGEPAGLLVLHHGRGADELDLLPLAEALDPKRRLHVVLPRGPLPGEGGGYRWYLVPSPGQPDRETFESSIAQLGELHDELWRETGIAPEQTVLGGFSMGSMMSYALGLGADRPAPAGILAMSGFLPHFDWAPRRGDTARPRLFVSHGTRDPVIDLAHGREAVQQLRGAGLEVEYHESETGHHVDPRLIPQAAAWLAQTIPARLPPRPAANA